MNDVAFWIILGITVAFVAIEKSMKIYSTIAWKRNGRKRRKDSNPGYGEKIGRLEERMDDVVEDVRAIKDKLNLI